MQAKYALVSLFAIWLLRDNPIGGYISPVVSIFVAFYLMFGYIKRIQQSLIELTDKTLPEEQQMKNEFDCLLGNCIVNIIVEDD